MRFCVMCGGNNPDDSLFCFNCGAPLGGQGQQQGVSQPQMQGQPSAVGVGQSAYAPQPQSAAQQQAYQQTQTPQVSFQSHQTYQPTQIQPPESAQQVLQQEPSQVSQSASQHSPNQPLVDFSQPSLNQPPTGSPAQAFSQPLADGVPQTFDQPTMGGASQIRNQPSAGGASQAFTQTPSNASSQAFSAPASNGSQGQGAAGVKKSNIIVIAVAAIAVIAIVVVIFASGVLNPGGGSSGGAGASGGASGGAVASAPATPAIQVTPKSGFDEYSWEELKAISNEISAAADRDAALKVAAKYNIVAADGTMDRKRTKTLMLSDGITSHVRIIGVYHDDLSSGGKAGLTFQFMEAVAAGAMNSGKTNDGGWEQSEMRSWLAKDFMSLLPSDLSSQIAFVDKKTNNAGETDDTDKVTVTSDQVWLPSFAEVAGQHSDGDFDKEPPSLAGIYNAEGTQYQLYREMNLTYNKANPDLVFKYVAVAPTSDSLKTGTACAWWQRSAKSTSSTNFCCTTNEGRPARTVNANVVQGIAPAFCL